MRNLSRLILPTTYQREAWRVEGERLPVYNVPVDHVQLCIRRRIDDALHRLNGLKVTATIDEDEIKANTIDKRKAGSNLSE